MPRPDDANIVYANCKGRFGRYSKLTGQEKQFYVGMANIYGANPKDLTYRFQRHSDADVYPDCIDRLQQRRCGPPARAWPLAGAAKQPRRSHSVADRSAVPLLPFHAVR